MEESTSTRLYVGNLPYTAQPKDIEDLFQTNEFTVTNIDMSIDPFSGRNPSYCFVDLASSTEASRALDQLNGYNVFGRPVKIRPGVPKRSSDGKPPQPRVKNYAPGAHGPRWTGGNSQGQSNARPSHSTSYEPTFDRWSRTTDAPDHWQTPLDEGTRLYVGGLPRIEPQSAVDAEIQGLFKGFDLTAVSKIISPHPSKADFPGNHYYVFVDLSSAGAVDAAMAKLNGAESPWGGQLRVSRARENRNRKVMREQYKDGRREGRAISSASWRRDE